MVGAIAPDFVAQDSSTSWLPRSSLRDKPIVLFFFRPGAPLVLDLARHLSRWRDDPEFRTIAFLGLAAESLEGVKRFREKNRLSIAVLRDPGSIARAYSVGNLPTVVLLDSKHIVRFRMDSYAGRGYGARLDATFAALKELPHMTLEFGQPLDLAYAENPRAPIFSARDVDGAPIDLMKLRGRVVVLNFFDQECPHCLEDLPAFIPALREFRDRGVSAVGITSRDAGGRLREFIEEHGIDYPVIVDEAREIFRKYESTRTPDTHIIDGDGFVRFREQGGRPDRTELTRLQLRVALGEEAQEAIAATLPDGRYLGDGMCRSCHAREYRDWLLTPHSIAWESLQQGDRWRDPECVSCHVTAEGHPGGYEDPERTPHLINVQCEVCHGRGGGHPSGAAVDLAEMSQRCGNCHHGKFVLNFDLDEALALVSHQDHPDMDSLFEYSDFQRQRLEQVNRRRLERFRAGVPHVGVKACRECHQSEYDQWVRTPHAAAYARLLKVDRGADPTCTACHTTGVGLMGGFGNEAATASMTNVQCEVCHGPGADHVAAPAEFKKGTIYGITDQCSFCIIRGVCTTCHDQENDPDFDIEAALPRVTHGSPSGG
jgi:peroxiredoxin/nitrate/TMAO reductase-like tetraheme cytochrome c subunit